MVTSILEATLESSIAWHYEVGKPTLPAITFATQLFKLIFACLAATNASLCLSPF